MQLGTALNLIELCCWADWNVFKWGDWWVLLARQGSESQILFEEVKWSAFLPLLPESPRRPSHAGKSRNWPSWTPLWSPLPSGKLLQGAFSQMSFSRCSLEGMQRSERYSWIRGSLPRHPNPLWCGQSEKEMLLFFVLPFEIVGCSSGSVSHGFCPFLGHQGCERGQVSLLWALVPSVINRGLGQPPATWHSAHGVPGLEVPSAPWCYWIKDTNINNNKKSLKERNGCRIILLSYQKPT